MTFVKDARPRREKDCDTGGCDSKRTVRTSRLGGELCKQKCAHSNFGMSLSIVGVSNDGDLFSTIVRHTAIERERERAAAAAARELKYRAQQHDNVRASFFSHSTLWPGLLFFFHILRRDEAV